MKTYSVTDVGMVRRINQDFVYVSEKPIGNLPNLFVVADGMGGHKAGDYASKFTVEILTRVLKHSSETDPERALVQAIKTANHELMQVASANEDLKGMADCGYSYVKENYTRAKVTGMYVKLVEELTR
jgi:protein phosphatase